MIMSGTGFIINVMIKLLQIYNFLILARVLLSWFIQDPSNKIYQFLQSVTEPILGPLRRILPAMGGWDLSPIVAYLLINIIIRLLFRIL